MDITLFSGEWAFDAQPPWTADWRGVVLVRAVISALSRLTSRDTIALINRPRIGDPMSRRKYAWETLSDEELLRRRLSSLKVTVEGTWLEDCVKALHEELEQRGIRLRPHTWISTH